jgi:hypothetical protein
VAAEPVVEEVAAPVAEPETATDASA